MINQTGFQKLFLVLGLLAGGFVSAASNSGVTIQLVENTTQTPTDLQSLENLFEQAGHPQDELSSGWYSGRCYSVRAPQQEVSGLMVLLHGHGHTKFHIPAYALDSDTEMWDELDQAEIDRVNEYNFIAANDYATSDGMSLVSGLKYEYESIGKLYLRQRGNVFYLKMANNPPEEDGDGALKFYCYFNKQVR